MNDIFCGFQFPNYKIINEYWSNCRKVMNKIDSLTSGTIWCQWYGQFWNYFVVEGYLTSANWHNSYKKIPNDIEM